MSPDGNLTMKRSGWLLASGVMLILYWSVSWYFGTQMVAFHVRTLDEDRQRLKIESIASFGQSKPESVAFRVADLTLRGWYFSGTGNCAAVFLHGFGSTRFGMLKYTPLLSEKKCHMLLYDARHHGESDGDFGTFGYYEKTDLLAAVDWLQSRTGLDDTHTAIIGESYGASTALLAAGESGRLFWFLLADSPYRNMSSIIEEQAARRYTPGIMIFTPAALFLASQRANFDPQLASPIRSVPSIRSPVFIVHSKTDRYTLPRHSEELAGVMAASGVRYRLLLTDWNSVHARSIDDNLPRYREAFNQFLADVVNHDER